MTTTEVELEATVVEAAAYLYVRALEERGRTPVDLVLAEHASRLLPFNEVAMVVGGSGRDVPLLAVLDGVTDEILDDVQALGAHGVALRGRPQQLLRAVRNAGTAPAASHSQPQLESLLR